MQNWMNFNINSQFLKLAGIYFLVISMATVPFRIVAQEVNTDISSIQSLIDQADKYLPDQSQEAIAMAAPILEEVTALGYEEGKIHCLSILGRAHKYLKNYTTSLDYFLQASKELERSGISEQQTAIQIEIGSLFHTWDAPDKAVEYYLLAYENINASKDPHLAAKVLGFLGSNYMSLSNRKEAIKYFELLLELNQEQHDQPEIFNTLRQLSVIYTANNNYQKAIDCQLQMLELKKAMGQIEGQVVIINSLGYLYKNQNNNNLALEFFRKSLDLSRKLVNTQPESKEDVILMNIALIYQAKGEYGQALQSLFSALKIRTENGDSLGAGDV
ncbi:MAG: tetratricopeptide repeat protein, partial [Cyclobacteriaceae bacterium]